MINTLKKTKIVAIILAMLVGVILIPKPYKYSVDVSYCPHIETSGTLNGIHFFRSPPLSGDYSGWCAGIILPADTRKNNECNGDTIRKKSGWECYGKRVFVPKGGYL
jgi:hypothetical protein